MGLIYRLIVPSFAGNAFFIFLIRQYMRTFPRDLDEAAKIDGCSYFGIFRFIILPLCRPVLAVVMWSSCFSVLGAICWGRSST